jgi:dTDP-4-amino-4,6-dideoxygalactose transaminase
MAAEKHSLAELALLGGRPAFDELLHVGRPNLGDRQRLLDRVNDLLDRRWLTNDGPYVQEFERRLVDLLGVRHCVAMCNGTVALEVAIRAAALSGEVIVPAFTFIATAHALQWLGITPVFCDVEPTTHSLDPRRVEALITPRTTGILGVHLWGEPCQIEALSAIARTHHLRLLFDAAHAFSCSYGGRMLGNFGDAEVLSFHATKFFNTFEGGAVLTNDDELATRLRLMRNFGFIGYDDVASIGTNGKMSEISAAMGLTDLESLDDFVAVNYRNFKDYQRLLADVPGVRLLPVDQSERRNYQYVVLEIDESITHVSRDQILAILWAENVRARRYFYPGCHRMEPYRSSLPDPGCRLPQTERLVRRVLVLPTGTAVDLEAISTICAILRLVISRGLEVAGRLALSPDRVPLTG